MNRYVVTVLLFLCPATSLFAVAEEVPAPDWASYSEEVNLSATDWLDNSGNAFQLWTGTVQVVENGENQEYEVSVTWNPQALSRKSQSEARASTLRQTTPTTRISFQTAAMPGVLGYIYVYDHSIGGARMDGRSCSHAFDYSYRRDRYQRLVQRVALTPTSATASAREPPPKTALKRTAGGA